MPAAASQPMATLSAAAVVILPALLSLAIVHAAFSQSGRSKYARMMYSLAVGYGVVLLMQLPALLVFVELGVDTL